MSSLQHVFIAHSAEDSKFADALAASMSRPDVTIVRDSQIEAGPTWAEGVRRGVEEASALVLVVPSSTASNRNNAWFEAGAAQALGKRVIAIFLSKERHQTLPPDSSDWTIVPGINKPVQALADVLANALRGAAMPPADAYALAAENAAVRQ